MSDFPFGRQPPPGPPPYEAVNATGPGIIKFGLAANQPAFGTQGVWYFQTDTGILQFDTGSSWETVATAGGGGAVSSVSNSDGTLTIAPTTGAVVASTTFGGTATASAPGDAESPGAAASSSRSDHLHGRESYVTNSIALGTAAAAGAAAGVIHPDATIAAFDATVPTTSAVGDAAATGAAAVAARRDHKHGREAFGNPPAMQTSWNQGVTNGVATSDARSDHNHGTMLDPWALGMAMWFGNPGSGTATAWPTASASIYTRSIMGSQNATNYNIVVGTASGNIDIGIYASTGSGSSAAPSGAPVVHKGSTACPASGSAVVSLGTQTLLVQGTNWGALAVDNTTATFDRVTSQDVSAGAGNNVLQTSNFPLSTAGSVSNQKYTPSIFTS